MQRLAARYDVRMGVAPQNAKIRIEPARHVGLFAWWPHLRPTGATASMLLPIRGWGQHRDDDRGTGLFRPATIGNTINIFVGDDGRLKAKLTRDMTEVFATSRQGHRPLTDMPAVDFGLRTLFATHHRILLVRGYRAKIESVAHLAVPEAARMQKAGNKCRDSALCGGMVTRLSPTIETEVNRALNHAVGARNVAFAVIKQPADHETTKGHGRSDLPGAPSPVGRQRLRKASSSSGTRRITLRDLVRRFDESMTGLRSVSRPRRGKSGATQSAQDPRPTNPYWNRNSPLVAGKSDEPRKTVITRFAVAT